MNRQYTLLVALVAAQLMAACDEPYSRAVNENENPSVEKILIRDTLGVRELLPEEAAALEFTFEEGAAVYPTSHVWFRLNKLLLGDTVEMVETDEGTGRELGQCKAADGGVQILEDAVPVDFVRACYNPGTLVIGMQKATEDYVAVPFLRYQTNYDFRISPKVTDKAGRAFADTIFTVRPRPFELLSAVIISSSARLYGAQDTGFAMVEPAAEVVTSDATQIRLLFSGPMHGDAAIASLAGVKLVDGDGNEVLALDEMGQPVHSLAHFQQDGAAVVSDPRLIVLTVPHARLGDGSTGLPPGHYSVEIPTTVTDDGSVMGVPTALGGHVSIAFTVVDAPQR